MRIGAYIENFHNAEEWAQIHVQHGYGAAYWPFQTITYEAEDSVIQTYIDAAERHRLVIAEVGAWCNVLDRNPEVSEKNIRYCIGQLKLADRVGARCCVNIVGSLHPSCWDGPHPDNLTDQTFDRIVKIIQRIIDEANPTRTYYTVEPMPWMYPCDIESMHRLIDAVNRPQFGVHVDMCNLINSYDKVYRSGEMTRRFFREFAPLIRSVHAKDTILEGTLTMHIHETIPGRGIFDHAALLEECSRLDPDLPVMAEHLQSEAEYVEATDFIKRKARELNLAFLT